jgi:hypothetical protein
MRLDAWAVGLLVLSLTTALAAAPDPGSAKLNRARDLYYAGRYREALPLLDAIASDTSAKESERIDGLKYQAFSLYLLKLHDEAKVPWLKILSLKPGYELDPIEVSPELIAFFRRIKPPESGRSPPPATPSPVVPEPTSTPPPDDGPSTPPAPAPEAPAAAPAAPGCPAWLCVVPFGAGQFANGSPGKGLIFAGTELAFLVGNITLYWLRLLNYERDGIIRDQTASDRAYVTQHVFLGLFVATAVTGVIEAFVSR